MSRLALSLKQPWAALLVAGRKSIEVRRWTTRYRGELLIHAARVDDERPEAWAHVDDAVRPLAQMRGGVIGAGVLAEVRAYRASDTFAADQGRHLNEPDWFEAAGLYGFRFDLLRAVPFVRVPGNVRLFAVEVEIPDPPSQPDAPARGISQPDAPAREVEKPLAGASGCDTGLFNAILQRFRRLARTLGRRPEGE